MYPCRTFLFNDPIPSVGEWSITVTADSLSYPVNASLIVSFYPSDLILQAFVPAENLIVGHSVDIITLLPTLVDLGKTEDATTTIFFPNGSNETLKLEGGPSNSIKC